MGTELLHKNLKERVLGKARSERTKKAIKELDRELKLDGRKLTTRRNYLQRINLLLEWWKKPIEKMTREDSLAFIEYMKDRGISPNSVEMHKYIMNTIQTYVFGKEPEWLRDKKRNRKNRMFNVKRMKMAVRKDVLTSEDVRKMVERAKRLKDKAILMTLWETGARVDCEFLEMRIRDVSFDQYGCLAVVGDPQESKTGQRTNRLVDSSPFIEAWIKEHPNPKPENYLWVSERDMDSFNPKTKKRQITKKGKKFTYQAINKIIKDLGKQIGKPDISSRDFRRGRATELSQQINPYEMCVFLGWELDSSMPKIYINRSGIDTDRKILQNRGLVRESGENGNGNHLETRLCPKCGKPNLITSRFCYGCGSYLEGHERKTEKQAFAENFMNFATQDSEFVKVMEKVMGRFVREKAEGAKNN